MRAHEFIIERRANPEVNVKVPFAQQVDAIIKKNGGTINDYWVSSTDVDRLGFYGGDSTHPKPEVTRPGKAVVVPTEPFQGQRKYHSPEYATYAGSEYSGSGQAQYKYGLWFMPLSFALKSLNNATYPYLRKFVFLVKLNDDAWLQPVDSLQKTRANLIGIKPPAGKHKIGQYNSFSHIAVLFEPAYKIVGKWTGQEIKNNARREQIGSVAAQQMVGQQRADAKRQQERDLEDLFTESVDADQVLKYVKSIHHDFHIDDTILTHPEWELTRVPLNKLHIPDPESGEDLDDPYNRVQMIDMYHVDDITRHDIERKPIVVDTDGHIIDGNYRALAARLSGLKDIPAYVPAQVNENFADGKVKGKSRPGRVKRAGASCAGSVTDLRAKAKKYGGERGKMYHWCANMKGGKKK